ncbi:histidinol-phosphatase HisJ family protein [bacterium]|nr:histidinol-phosphatase HisJ family protein [bacterium]
MKKDYHIHSYFSKDSKLDPDKLIQKAIELNYQEIAFTDHLEFLFPQWSFHEEYSYQDYYDFFSLLKAKYAPKINILSGVEIGEYHQTKTQVTDYFGHLKPDLILGSIHTLLPKKDISLPFQEPLSPAEIISYYKSNLELVETCDLDILAHLGIFTRFLPHNIKVGLPICKDIFQVMKEKNIALEINFSGLRKTTKQFLPHFQVLDLYAMEEGKLISIGSDTHQLSDFDDNYDNVLSILDEKGYPFLVV